MLFTIRSWFAQKNPARGKPKTLNQENDAVPALAPTTEVAVIGDIHGRLDLLGPLLKKLDAKYPDAQRVFVGDYIDRGPDSLGVLAQLKALGDGAICLMGNHEAM
ncbi:MAG: metallophosphoesterase, partial [Marinosulfonomonas sp.]|nr:metallophosphoesterase [Marinosulfonomonas sp.]